MENRDMGQIASLFYETVHAINKRDYPQAQLKAWAPSAEKTKKSRTWEDALNQNKTYVAEINNQPRTVT